MRHPRPQRAQVVTEARPSRSADIAYRERRYLIMMGIRLVCFVIAVVLFVNGAGWLTAIPAVGAIIIPYFAVIFANGGREPNGGRGFQAYEPNLPERFAPDIAAAAGPGPRPQAAPGTSGPPGAGPGATGHTGPGSGASGPGASGPGASGPGESGTTGNHGESGTER